MRVLIADGPAPWAGTVALLADTAGELGATLERTLPGTEDEYVLGVWACSGETVDVDVTRRRRHDVIVERKPAVVYRFSGERRVPRYVERRQTEPVQMQIAA